MARDAAAVRGDRPVLFTSIRQDPTADEVATWVRDQVDSWLHQHH
jgi:urease accessory protein